MAAGQSCEGPMKTPDTEVVLSAMEDMRRILREYIEPRRLRDRRRQSIACSPLSIGRTWSMR
jgi:hypothetical protein